MFDAETQRYSSHLTGTASPRWLSIHRTIVVTERGRGRRQDRRPETPHLLFGHELGVASAAVSPDGKWIASAGDGTIRLWPMPEGTPLHTLPYEELLAKLRSLTNVRLVPDESSETGYRVEIGPFPGWKKFPTW
jgi:WD40 repeat protein